MGNQPGGWANAGSQPPSPQNFQGQQPLAGQPVPGQPPGQQQFQGPPHGPPPQGWPHGGAVPVVADVGKTMLTRAVIGAVVAGSIGVFTLIMTIGAAFDGGGGIVFVFGLIGIVFLGIGLIPVFMWKKISRPRKLVFEPQGVRWDDPQGQPWAVPWNELAAVSISRTIERRVQLHQYLIPRKIMVRLDLFPGDSAFRQRHPEMEYMWEFHTVQNGYRLPLGSNPRFIPIIEQGMRAFAPNVYRGVVDEGFIVGLV